MPVIKKQSVKKVEKRRTGDVFDRVAPVSQVDSGGIKLSLYGRSKTGKTRLVSSFNQAGKVLIIGAEDGTRSIRTVKNVDFVRVILDGAKVEGDNHIYLEQMGELINGIVDQGYKTVALDTASSFADLVLADILGLVELPPQKSWGMASRDQYGQQSLRVRTTLRQLLELPINVVIVAQERVFGEDATSDLIFPTVGSALSPSVAGWLNAAVEYICQTYIREKVVEKIVKVAGKDVKTTQKTGGVEYCLRVGPDPVYTTGFRLPPGEELPDSITDPSYTKIMKLVNGEV